MDKRLKIGYIAFGISFLLPNFSLEYIGVAMAITSVVNGVALLLDSVSSALIGALMLSFFFLNFGVLPGIEAKKAFRIIMAIWPWTAAFVPQLTPENQLFFLFTVPPYLLWAASISYLNFLKIKRAKYDEFVQSQS